MLFNLINWLIKTIIEKVIQIMKVSSLPLEYQTRLIFFV